MGARQQETKTSMVAGWGQRSQDEAMKARANQA